MKQSICKILMLIMFLSALIPAFGYDFEVDGIYYKVTSASELTCGVVNGGQDSEKYKGNVTIPAQVNYRNKLLNVTSIEGGAFYNCSQLNTVVIPETVVKIEAWAFENCTKLTSINLPNSITSLGTEIFKDCTALKDIHLPEEITSIPTGMFYNCSAIESILLPPTVVEIRYRAFGNCCNLSSIDFPDGIEYIGAYSFENCAKISKLELPYSLSTIGGYAFNGLNLIQKVVLPESLEHIGEYAFSNCSELMEIDIASSTNPLYFDQVCKNYIYTCGTFFECPKLTHLTLGREIKEYDTDFERPDDFVAESIFNGNITSLNILDNVNFWEVFSEGNFSETLEHLTLGTYSFPKRIKLYYYKKLKKITLTTSIPPECPVFSDKQLMDIVLQVPNGSLNTYQTADGWKYFWNIEEVDILGGIDAINDNSDISIQVENGIITVNNKKEFSAIRIYTLQGQLIKETYQSEVHGLPCGLYIISIDYHTFKVVL